MYMTENPAAIISAFLESMRPRQWVKNVFVLSPLFFSRNLVDTQKLLTVLIACLVFCLISGITYVCNDCMDLQSDRAHPIKSARPIASGKLDLQIALLGAFIVTLIALTIAFFLGQGFFIVCVSYLFLQTGYSTFLKHFIILDVFAIAAGFVLRVVAGAIVIDVSVSAWILLCTLLLALFLALGKRRYELVNHYTGASHDRKVLGFYTTAFIDQMITSVCAMTVIAYSMYTIAPSTVRRFDTENLIFTVPLVLFGLFRYLFLIHRGDTGENPEKVVVTDGPIIVVLILWAAVSASIIYTA